ncbi:hypothetical protein EYF80_019353 [Liparis tanakae]|uniref:Uncharacterized protein n=1 Tax=Liparis tanakae TaxID=230148 RepID=A0A4Z2HX85_9TELE|nr:hypothetical protein EYF80_019353 [Liparis tanakae]
MRTENVSPRDKDVDRLAVTGSLLGGGGGGLHHVNPQGAQGSVKCQLIVLGDTADKNGELIPVVEAGMLRLLSRKRSDLKEDTDANLCFLRIVRQDCSELTGLSSSGRLSIIVEAQVMDTRLPLAFGQD